ncbi:MAG: S4 domain-containing protein [Trueperaceae bacterium]
MNDVNDLIKGVRAGRVLHTGFLEPLETAALVAKLRQADVSVNVSGGYPGAKRRVVTAFPEHVPEANTPLVALYVAEAHDADELRVGLHKNVSADALGDIIEHQDGLSAIVLRDAVNENPVTVRGKTYPVRIVELEKVATGTRKRQNVIVPALRVDALGAKAFNVSRSYFAKGVAAGNVFVNGQKATKSTDAEAGDEIYAEGLGRFSVVSVQGETKKGNLKIALEIEKS